MKVGLDVESAGLKGDLHLIQYSINRGPVKILRVHNKQDFRELLNILNNKESILIGYNIGFDLWKLYQYFRPQRPFDCQVIDLWIHAVKGIPLKYYPFTHGKKVVRLRKIPLKYSEEIEKILTGELKKVLPPFALIKVTHEEEKEPPGVFQTLSFSVRMPAKLKILAAHLLLSEEERAEVLNFDDVLYLPQTLPPCPMTGEKRSWREETRFPNIQKDEKTHYQSLYQENERLLDKPEIRERAFEYARKDVEYLWKLEDYLVAHGNEVKPTINDCCTHIVSYTKYHGFAVDVEGAEKLYDDFGRELFDIENDLKINVASFKQRQRLLQPHLPEGFPELESTAADKLKILLSEDLLTPEGQEIAEKLLRFNPLSQRRKQLEVLIHGGGKIHPDFRVMGTSTGRMAGTGGLNFQGIARDGEIRNLVYASMGGDFDGLEWTIAGTFFEDSQILAGLADGKDPHTVTLSLVTDRGREIGYEGLMKIKKDPEHLSYSWFKKARNDVAKRLNFAVLYFCGEVKAGEILGVMPEDALEYLEEHFFSHYKSLQETRERFYADFCTADFDGWSRESVNDMKDKVLDIWGNERFVCFERYMANFLWKNTDRIASVASGDDEEVLRMQHKGLQKIGQSIRSACLGAASAIQQAVYRQLGNYPIQSAGAYLTKMLMVTVWQAHRVPLMQIHDELLVPSGYEHLFPEIKKTVAEFLHKNRKIIAYLGMEFKLMKTWGEK